MDHKMVSDMVNTLAFVKWVAIAFIPALLGFMGVIVGVVFKAIDKIRTGVDEGIKELRLEFERKHDELEKKVIKNCLALAELKACSKRNRKGEKDEE